MNKLKMFLGMLICISFLFVSSAWAGDVAIRACSVSFRKLMEIIVVVS